MIKPKDFYKRHLNEVIKNITRGERNYVVLKNTIADIPDVQSYLKKIYSQIDSEKRIVITYYNHFWEPILKLASYFNLAEARPEQNWLDQEDIKNLLSLTGFEVVTSQKKLLLPIDIPLVSTLINKYVAILPLINSFCLTTIVVARPKKNKIKEYSVSIIVPARNEAGNIKQIVRQIPKFSKSLEIVFVEGNSTDDTWKEIQNHVSKHKQNKKFKLLAYRQKGKGKADAVRLGMKNSSGDILMIYDADMTVNAKDLVKFYEALVKGHGEFINGSRLVYPMEKDAMRTLNKIGNKFFSIIFTWLLGQRFKDTLCGTKAIFRKRYINIVKHRRKFGSSDPFGDFDLIFGAVRQNLKVIEIPVRYKERVYGSTNINRFRHGLQLFKMTWIGLKEFKIW